MAIPSAGGYDNATWPHLVLTARLQENQMGSALTVLTLQIRSSERKQLPNYSLRLVCILVLPTEFTVKYGSNLKGESIGFLHLFAQIHLKVQ